MDTSLNHAHDHLIAKEAEYADQFQEFMDNEEIIIADQQEIECYQDINICCGSLLGCLRSWLPCFCCCLDYPYVEVPQSSRYIQERFGKPIAVLYPGLNMINTCTDQVKQMSFKIKILDLPKQSITTKDNVMLFVGKALSFQSSFIFVQINRCSYLLQGCGNHESYLQNRKSSKGTYGFYQIYKDQSTSAIRSIFGEMVLTQILDSKETISESLQQLINEQSKKWGTIVEEIFFKDISFGKETQDDMAAAAKQRRLGESKLISNKADVQAAILLKQTAEILDSKAAMQVRYLEVLQNIMKSSKEQVIFLPINTFTSSQK